MVATMIATETGCERLQAYTPARLESENQCYKGSGGISQENHRHRFLPAFLDTATGRVYLSRHPDGRRAPIHLLDGLPERLILQRTASGKVIAVKSSVTSGFLRDRRFYTREQAARAISRQRL